LGFAGVVQFGGIRIGGLSGIYKDHDFRKGHFERAPYNKDNIKSVYHVRQYDVLKLMEVRGAIDIFVSHDWPRGITKYGDAQQLLRQKPHFQQDIETNQLGSKAGEQLLHALKPLYWFSAHLHTKFSALVPHPDGHHPTKFLALDKCLPRRNFLQVIFFPYGNTNRCGAITVILFSLCDHQAQD
jgi:lariat debranching enzyme